MLFNTSETFKPDDCLHFVFMVKAKKAYIHIYIYIIQFEYATLKVAPNQLYCGYAMELSFSWQDAVFSAVVSGITEFSGHNQHKENCNCRVLKWKCMLSKGYCAELRVSVLELNFLFWNLLWHVSAGTCCSEGCQTPLVLAGSGHFCDHNLGCVKVNFPEWLL